MLSHLFWPVNAATMSETHVKRCRSMRFMRLEVSPAGCFSWLCALCFRVFLNSVVTLMSMHARLPYMGMPGHASSVHTPALCSLLHRLLSALSLRCKVLISVNEGKLTLLNFSEESNIRQKLMAFLFLGQQKKISVRIYLQHFLNLNKWVGLMAKLLLKDHCSHVTWSSWRLRSASCKKHFMSSSVPLVFILCQ